MMPFSLPTVLLNSSTTFFSAAICWSLVPVPRPTNQLTLTLPVRRASVAAAVLVGTSVKVGVFVAVGGASVGVFVAVSVSVGDIVFVADAVGGTMVLVFLGVTVGSEVGTGIVFVAIAACATADGE